jgi:hypothetical protein
VRRFTIDSSVLGTPRHILGDSEGFAWSDSVPRDSWHLSGSEKTTASSRCLDTLLRLDGRTVVPPPDRYLKALRCLVTGTCPDPVPWRHFLPQDEFRKFFKNVVQETTDAFSNLPFDYYEVAWAAGSRLLAALRPAAIDVDRLEAHMSSGGANVHLLEGFRPKRSGFARPVTYDRFGTRTGRLTVADGPNILVLKKEFRDVLRSSYDGGSVVSLDFRALEARIVLAEAGRTSDAADLYAHLADSLFGGSFPRDAVKVAVIAELYGISRSTLKARLPGVTDKQLDGFVSLIRSHFGVAPLRLRLKEELASTGRIRNRFGRPLTVPAGQDNLLVNTYAQSTGVDVAMIGFDSVLRTLGEDGIRPLFVLHDALLLDVRSDRLPDVTSLSSVPVSTYEAPFPLKPE